jgi:hypothetical protein
MVGRPKSNTRKLQAARTTKDELYARAVALYKHEQQREENGTKRMSLRKVCEDIQHQCWAESKKEVKLDYSTVRRLVNGGTPKSISNASRGWLLSGEVDVIIGYAIEVASRGFPLSHARLREHVNEICDARLGDKFPAQGVGRRWTSRFVEKHADRLTMYWAHPLDNTRGRAVNPITNTQWFDILGTVMRGGADSLDNGGSETMEDEEDWEPILEQNTFAADECGFMALGGTKQRVIGASGKTTQHQQGDGGRENTTVIVTICADGSSLKPSVIFKGQAFQVKWDQENPAEALYEVFHSCLE